MKIIDVSYAQGKIYWNKVKNSGVEGAIIRCGYGKGNIDEWAQANIEGALNAGLHVGVYWFSYAYTADMAKKEARFCNDVANAWKDKIDIGMYWDFEGDSIDWMKKQGKKPSKSLITSMAEAFCAEAESLGYKGGYYSFKNCLDTYFDENKLTQYRRWLAWWDKEGEKEKCYIWQYSSKGVVDGIKGNCDMDTLYEAQPTPQPTPAPSDYRVGNVYTVTATALNVRKGPGTNYGLVGYANLTPDGKRHAYPDTGALKQGTRVTCLEVRHTSGTWMRIPSGWICAVGSKKYVE